MKTAVKYAQMMLVLLTGVLPVSWIFGIVTDYETTLHMPRMYTWATAVCALGVVFMMHREAEKESGSELKASPLHLPLALLYALSLLWLARWEKVIIPVFINLLCATQIFRRYVRKSALRILCMVFACMLILPYLIFLPGVVLMSDFGKTTVVQTLVSPDGRYQAMLVDIDQGALGGNTDVYVKDTEKYVDLGAISYQKKTLVYRTGWGAFEDVELAWKDKETILIDGIEYSVR